MSCYSIYTNFISATSPRILIQSTDEQALDLLSSAAAHDVRLVRTTKDLETTYMTALVSGDAGTQIMQSKDIALAVFQPVDFHAEQLRERSLFGQIPIPSDLPPGFQIFNYTLEVRITRRTVFAMLMTFR